MNHLTQRATDIRSTIRNAEALSDELLGALASLKIKMLAFRSHPEVEPHAGQKAFIRLQSAEQHLISAANDLFRTHDELVDAAIKMDVEEPTYIDLTRGSGLSENVTAASVEPVQPVA